MAWFRKNEDEFVDDQHIEGRPIGSDGTTGLMFNGWYAVASQSLMHASRDDDPRCQKVLCIEARIGCKWATQYAKNSRQAAMCTHLSKAIDDLYRQAQDAPPLEVPHNHPMDRDGQ